MKINCPYEWKTRIKLGNIIWENSFVEIFNGICNCSDLCGITTCEFYDVTEEGTRLFVNAMAYGHTIEGILDKRHIEAGGKPWGREKPRRHIN
ncbi:MAG: hypothetical protein KAV00_14280 [Phycisphaerae bacterium]|nr:hypothetical protein [Phycisphaerae bacterium]